jgi:hypothetical protein
MIDYNIHLIAHDKYQAMQRSLVPDPDYADSVLPDEPGWLSRQVGRLLCRLGNTLTDLGFRVGGQRPTAALQSQLEQQSGPG